MTRNNQGEAAPSARGVHGFGPEVEITDPSLVHETALIFGRVRLDRGVSVWPYVVMRAEMHAIEIGEDTNIQDFVMVHVGAMTPTIVGANCSITHRATIHGCKIGENTMIGIGATIMDGAVIGRNSVVAGHAIVGENKVFEDNAVIAGVPARQVATRDNTQSNLINARFYSRNAANYAKGQHRFSEADIGFILGTGAKPVDDETD
ncbi:MAG: gamma carbonic anhydrase family protein [Pseudomonadota bacterium]